REDDRQKAIEKAIGMAKKGDIVVVTGKGHEKSMCFGKTEYPWSDKDAVIKSISNDVGIH
ncbi:MAG: UDP-N-acetylmuramoyl-L-alanyl-D-glutamate--2,6-diaminopimelate ligase, partial [Patescibacteria group bacterium]